MRGWPRHANAPAKRRGVHGASMHDAPAGTNGNSTRRRVDYSDLIETPRNALEFAHKMTVNSAAVTDAEFAASGRRIRREESRGDGPIDGLRQLSGPAASVLVRRWSQGGRCRRSRSFLHRRPSTKMSSPCQAGSHYRSRPARTWWRTTQNGPPSRYDKLQARLEMQKQQADRLRMPTGRRWSAAAVGLHAADGSSGIRSAWVMYPSWPRLGISDADLHARDAE